MDDRSVGQAEQLAAGLAHRRGEPLTVAAGAASTRRRQATEFVLEVVDDAHRL